MDKNKFICLLFLLFCVGQLEGQNLATKQWIFFKDKGPQVISQSAAAFKMVAENISPRAMKRRAKMKTGSDILDHFDLPVYPNYLQAVESAGGKIVVISRWLNACSAFLSTAQISELERLSFVDRITPVRPMRTQPQDFIEKTALSKRTAQNLETQYDYGAARDQIVQIKAHLLHNADVAGAGVLFGLLDSGFYYKKHPAFASLQVVGEYDFIFGDENTANEADDIPVQHDHGTQVLSVAAGFAPGELIGPAFRARFFLAKTEDLRSETPAEEDNWVAAIEWMEARGVDVASTSLGYSDFDPPYADYTWSDLDGNTATTTIAAQIATTKGVVVVCSAGNAGSSSWRYITPPADARDAITVGAVQKDSRRSAFSSIGPSFYSRTKPDVMALGSSVTMVDPRGTAYTTNGGTSFSAPLVAGVVAQILSVHPDLTPAQVMEALHNTASRASNPDSLYGWGIIDAQRAITYWGPAFGPVFHVEMSCEETARISFGFLGGPEMDTTSLMINWRPESMSEFTGAALAPIGQTQYQSPEIPVQKNENVVFYLTAASKAGDVFFYPDTAAGGLFSLDYLGRVQGHDESLLLPPNPAESFYLFHPFPNPFMTSGDGKIRFAFDLRSPAAVSLTVYNLLGQKIAAPLQNFSLPAGPGFRDWCGADQRGKKVTTGVYFLVAKFRQTDGRVVIKKRKLLLLN